MAKKILVIDDEKLVTGSLEKLLKKVGYIVKTAQNYQEALEAIGESYFDLIISDVRIPDKDGIEIIKGIRAYLQQNQKTPIPEILITGYASKEKYQSAVDLNIRGYINKPFDVKEFLATVEGVLSEK